MSFVNKEQFIKNEQASRDTIDVKRIYVDMAGDLVGGMLLSQIVFWHLPNPSGNSKLRVYHEGEYWIARGRDDWWEDCRITARQFDRVSTELQNRKYIKVDLFKFDGTPKIHVRLDWDNFLVAYEKALNGEFDFALNVKSRRVQNEFNGKRKVDIAVNDTSLTESTSEITTESGDEKTTSPTPQEQLEATKREFESMPSQSDGMTKLAVLDTAVADPQASKSRYVKTVGTWFGDVLSHQYPSSTDKSAAGQCFELHYPMDKLLEFCRFKDGKYVANGKEPNAYWIKNDFDEWRTNGYPPLEKVNRVSSSGRDLSQ